MDDLDWLVQSGLLSPDEVEAARQAFLRKSALRTAKPKDFQDQFQALDEAGRIQTVRDTALLFDLMVFLMIRIWYHETQFADDKPLPIFMASRLWHPEQDRQQERDMAAALSDDSVQVAIWNGPFEKSKEIVVMLPSDRVGILADMAGVLAVHYLDIQAAEINVHADYVLDRYVVRLSDDAALDFERNLATLRQDLSAVLKGRRTVADLYARDNRDYTFNLSRSAVALGTVSYFEEEHGHQQLVVLTQERNRGTGLLHVMTRWLAVHGLNIEEAHIRTQGKTALNTFVVTASDGSALSHEQQQLISAQLTRFLNQPGIGSQDFPSRKDDDDQNNGLNQETSRDQPKATARLNL